MLNLNVDENVWSLKKRTIVVAYQKDKLFLSRFIWKLNFKLLILIIL